MAARIKKGILAFIAFCQLFYLHKKHHKVSKISGRVTAMIGSEC